MSMGIHESNLKPAGYQQIAIDSVSELDVPENATTAILTVEGAAARYRDDGGDPTATVGNPLAADAPFYYTGDLRALRVIGAGAKLNVNFYKRA